MIIKGVYLHSNQLTPNTFFRMKKLFLLFAVAGFVLTSCGSNAQKQEEAAVVEQTDSTTVVITEAADSSACCGDSTKVVDAVQE